MGVSMPLAIDGFWSHKTATPLRPIIFQMPMKVSNAIQRSPQKSSFGPSQHANLISQHIHGSSSIGNESTTTPSLRVSSYCQCNNNSSNETIPTPTTIQSTAYLITKSVPPSSCHPKRALTPFNLLPLMIVFTNPITMTNKTYLKTNNTRTNDPKRSPPRKGTNNPGKASAPSKPLFSVGGQKKKVQQTLLSKSAKTITSLVKTPNTSSPSPTTLLPLPSLHRLPPLLP
jgi:hypothetical protein